MAYTPFDHSVPDAATQSIAQVTTSTRQNLLAMRDDLVLYGAMPGWAGEAQNSDGTPATDPSQAPQWMFSRGVERIKAVITYGSTGGAADNVETLVCYYSSDSGSTWDLIADTDYPSGTLSISYAADGTPKSYSWS